MIKARLNYYLPIIKRTVSGLNGVHVPINEGVSRIQITVDSNFETATVSLV